MVREICKDPVFLAQKAAPASADDRGRTHFAALSKGRPLTSGLLKGRCACSRCFARLRRVLSFDCARCVFGGHAGQAVRKT